jgi:hypothetical protein
MSLHVCSRITGTGETTQRITTEDVIPMKQNTVALALEQIDNYFTTSTILLGKTAAQTAKHIICIHGLGGSVLNCISDCVATPLRLERKAA